MLSTTPQHPLNSAALEIYDTSLHVRHAPEGRCSPTSRFNGSVGVFEILELHDHGLDMLRTSYIVCTDVDVRFTCDAQLLEVLSKNCPA